MIKKIILALLIMLPSMAFAQKFGTVDTEAIMTAMPEIKEMQATIDAASKKYEDEFANLRTEFQKKLEEYQGLGADTPETIKERRGQELQELDQKMQQFTQSAQNDLQQQQMRLLQPIQERVKQAISAVGAEGSFTFIFEKPMPLYSGSDVVDVTPLVKKKLNLQ
ncbi:MAG: OmpH family outer membrane protein [Pseudoflavonifractor sp.]|nr:OmpH family outer membrane protein [Alloprevotella sp.]MCM1116467.1 OmpH family outer membrane protein [Pseudoflavonifractor sp.]